MHNQTKSSFLFYTFTLFVCLSSFLLRNTAAQVGGSASDNYTFETIDVPGVDFLAVTASSDFEDYAGYTRSLMVKRKSPLHSLMAFLQPMISRDHRTLIFMRLVIMGKRRDTMRITTVSTTVSS